MTQDLSTQIQQFYDDSSQLWEQIWGEHMHHGYYGSKGTLKTDRRQAQINLIEELLLWANVNNNDCKPQNIIDVGCGIGGSTVYLAQKFGAKSRGISLSPVQVSRATERATEAGLKSTVQFQVADALKLPFADNSFDLVWSLESAEHFPNKKKFLEEAYRILQPGGKLIMATWCHRPVNSLSDELTEKEKRLLEEIYRVYCLPYVISLPEYENLTLDCGFKNLQSDDWSIAVAPFWDVVIDSAITPQAIVGLIQAGWKTIRAALSLMLMRQGYKRGLIRFGLITATK